MSAKTGGKTHKGLAKRIKITATGKVKHRKAGKSHLLSVKSGNALRKFSQSKVAPDMMAKKIIEAMVK